MVEDSSFSHKIDYVTGEYKSPRASKLITGSKVTTILLNGWVLPIAGVASGRVCGQPAKHQSFNFNFMKTQVKKTSNLDQTNPKILK